MRVCICVHIDTHSEEFEAQNPESKVLELIMKWALIASEFFARKN
jgi:hypothetical protein